MVGHTGNFSATVKAIEFIDKCLGRVEKACLATKSELMITADHGNAEMMFNPKTNQPHTAHTSDPVPFIYIGRPANFVADNGKLSDIAPTILVLHNLPKPPEMTGNSLLELL
jgi:2,3-bisphosphoglycerate-independent phosphoglycerate mutase